MGIADNFLKKPQIISNFGSCNFFKVLTFRNFVATVLVEDY